MPFKTVWGSDRVAWTPEGNITIPAEYVFVESGDGAKTRAIMKLARTKAAIVYRAVTKRKKHNRYAETLGIWVPPDCVVVEVKRSDPQKLADARERKEAREIAAFAKRILEDFPGCPPEEADVIARHACETGSGRVGRSKTAEDPVRLAVIAYIRHHYTDYEDHFVSGEFDPNAKEYARDRVRPMIEKKLTEWDSGSHQN